MSFDVAFKIVVGEEGDYSDNPDDKGGKTRYGVTEALARRYGYTGDMRDLPFDFARNVYQQEFWDGELLGTIDVLNPSIATELFDTSVNIGGSTAIRWLQRVLNVFNKQATFYADIAEDGKNGPASTGALSQYLRIRGEEGVTVLLRAFECLKGSYYILLAESNGADETFVYGWIRNRISI